MSNVERTGWRDESISARHRTWGVACTAVDLDFVLVEHRSGMPNAIVEYKHERARKQYSSNPNYRALINLGNASNIPVLACRYKNDFSKFIVTPLNTKAGEYVSPQTTFSENDYVRLMYEMRGYEDSFTSDYIFKPELKIVDAEQLVLF